MTFEDDPHGDSAPETGTPTPGGVSEASGDVSAGQASGEAERSEAIRETICDSYAREAPREGESWHRDGTSDDDLVDLSDTEAAVFRVLADAAYLRRTAQAKADAAGVSRATWFRVLHNPGFRARATEAGRRALDGYTAKVIDALGVSAQIADPEHAADRRLFFQLVGMDKPREAGPAKATAVSDIELLEACRDAGVPLPPAVLERVKAAGIPFNPVAA